MVHIPYQEEKFYLVGTILDQDSQKYLSIGEYFLMRTALGDLSAEPGGVRVLKHQSITMGALSDICDLTQDGKTFYAHESHIFQQVGDRAQFTFYGRFALHRCLTELVRERVTLPDSQPSHQ